MKINEELSNKIKGRYAELRGFGHTKEQARVQTGRELGVGRTSVWDHVHQQEEQFTETDSITPAWPKTYILTGWELRVGVDKKFVDCLKQMADLYDAELILVPLNKSDIRYMPSILKDNFKVLAEDTSFNSNLQLKYVETGALVQSPLMGHQGAYPDKTTILPGLIKELRTETSQHYVKQLISTGSVGYLNASSTDFNIDDEKELIKKWRAVRTRANGKTTAIANSYVVPSALVIDVLDNKLFLSRFVSSHRSGVVYDLNKKFTPSGYEDSTPSALVVGDTHAYNVDEGAWLAAKSMVRILNPKEVILNDFMDSVSVNHHEFHDPVKTHYAPSIREEADITKELLKEICDISNKVIYLHSNHDNFLISYLNSNNNLLRMNRNYEVACGLQLYRVSTRNHPIIKLLELDKISNLKFVEEKQNHYVGKVLVKHGHEGSNGARTGFLGLAKIYNHFVCGHFHTPGVFRNAMCVGLTAKLDLEYNIGASSWLHSCGLVHPDNSVQLLPIIEGRWYA